MATKERIVPKRNYLIVLGLIVLVICGCFAFYNIYNIMHDNMISASPLSKSSITIEDLKDASKDLSADTFLVISYTKDETVYNNEKAIKKLLNKYNLMDNVKYLDITDLIYDLLNQLP